jgi:hypothetical protein
MKKKNPNKTWKGEGERNAAAIDSNNHFTVPATIHTLATQKSFFKKEWPRRRNAFIVCIFLSPLSL